MVVKIILLLAFLYSAMFTLILLFQRKFQYHPYKIVDQPQDFDIAMETTHIKGYHDHALWAWYQKPHEQKPTIVYFHGNEYSLGWRAARFKHYVQKGYGLVCATYRYNAQAGGKPSEQALIADGKCVLAWLEDTLAVPKNNTIIYGESLGSGVATQLAKGSDYKGLVLEVPYDSMLSAAHHRMWMFPIFKALLFDAFDSKEHIQDVRIPVLIGGAERDRVLPVTQAYNLFAYTHEPKKFFLGKNAGHIEMYDDSAWAHVVCEFCEA